MMKKAFAISAAAILAGSMMFACSSSSDAAAAAANGDCPAVGSKACPNDPAEAQSDVDQCNQSKNDPKCGSQFTDVLKCEGSNLKCGSDGKVDAQGTLSSCGTQVNAYTTCLQGGSGDAG
ncbi:MAG: hypothetical protein ACRELY_01150 [Polyangiaceae bacterium]